MNADHFFRSAGCLIIGVCFTLVFISITNQQWMDTNCDSINVEAIQTHLLHANITNSTAHDMHSIFDTHHCHAVNYLQPFANVFELAKIINNLDLKSGIEIGTQEGNFTQAFLKEWKKVNEYVLSDEWVVTNKSAGNPKKVLALAKLKSASLNGTAICEGTALKCATRYPDLRFDFIFIDTHVITEPLSEILKAWWPKLRAKGIIAGHDYKVGVVDDFFSDATHQMKGCARQITISYREGGRSNIWAVRK